MRANHCVIFLKKGRKIADSMCDERVAWHMVGFETSLALRGMERALRRARHRHSSDAALKVSVRNPENRSFYERILISRAVFSTFTGSQNFRDLSYHSASKNGENEGLVQLNHHSLT